VTKLLRIFLGMGYSRLYEIYEKTLLSKGKVIALGGLSLFWSFTD